MKTKGDARAFYLNAIDESTKKGVDVAVSKNADYNHKFDVFLDDAQKYIAGTFRIGDVFQVTQNPIPNLLGLLRGFDIEQILPGTTKLFTFVGCKATYFQIDNIGTVTIKINGVLDQTIQNTVKGSFTAHQVLIPATSTDTVTIEFSGLYPYNIRNTGFYGYTFPLYTDIPIYTPHVSYDMPLDFLEFDAVIIKSDPRIYASYIVNKWQNNKKIILDYYDTGSFDIHYFKYPTTIAQSAPDETLLEIEDKAFGALALYCAVLATAADNPALSSWIRSIYIENIQNVTQSEQPVFNSVQTVFSMC